MKKEKVIANLIKDLFEIFRVKYGITIPYECTTNGWEYNVCTLDIPNCDSFYSPALVLQKTTAPNLQLVGIAPQAGYNEEIRGVLCEFNSSIGNSNFLWWTPEASVNGISRVLCFGHGSGNKELEALTIEMLSKAHELFYSGKYNTDINPEEEKESWMHA